MKWVNTHKVLRGCLIQKDVTYSHRSPQTAMIGCLLPTHSEVWQFYSVFKGEKQKRTETDTMGKRQKKNTKVVAGSLRGWLSWEAISRLGVALGSESVQVILSKSKLGKKDVSPYWNDPNHWSGGSPDFLSTVYVAHLGMPNGKVDHSDILVDF